MVKTLRTALNQALRDGFVDTNEASRVTLIKRLKKAKRRPFTKPEIRKLLKVADFEWRGIILCGLYTGLRISDIALLTWENLDLVNAVLTLESRKTERRMDIPIAPRLKQYFDELPAGDDPAAPLFPQCMPGVSPTKPLAPQAHSSERSWSKPDLLKTKTTKVQARAGEQKGK